MTKWINLLLLMGTLSTPGSELSAPRFYTHMCDGSAAVSLDGNHFVVGNDEDNILRVYDSKKGGAPEVSYDLGPFLKLKEKHPETDIEGAARIGDLIFWITSHGSNSEGKPRPNRRRLFATKVSQINGTWVIQPYGQPYHRLLEDLQTDKEYQSLNLISAAEKPPKTSAALNIEGLAEGPNGTLFIAFRNPIPDGEALVAILRNPGAVVEGAKPIFDAPLRLALGGLGIRDLARVEENRYLLIAGTYDGGEGSSLHLWNPSLNRIKKIDSLNFAGLNPESIILYPKDKRIEILSDDGTHQVSGQNCKDLSNPDDKKFRGFDLLGGFE